MAKEFDEFTCEVLPDGQIRSVTDPISPANHAQTEAFFRLLNELTGVTGKRTRRNKKHVHQHDHEHLKEGGHGHSH